MQSIYTYTDYRKFLFDFHAEGKKSGLSYRQIAASVGFKSAGHFTQILKGQAAISPALAANFARYCRLKPRQSAFFKTLVLYNQAADPAAKKRQFDRLASFTKSSIKIVNPRHYEFYSRWYYAAIRELIDIVSFTGDYAALAALLVPAITPRQARTAVALLERLDLVKKDGRGVYRKTDQVITTGIGASSVSINNFAVTLMDMAKSALESVTRDERNISWMTLTVSPASYAAIVDELRKFRRTALEIARADMTPEQVYQFNFQMFPLTRRAGRNPAP